MPLPRSAQPGPPHRASRTRSHPPRCSALRAVTPLHAPARVPQAPLRFSAHRPEGHFRGRLAPPAATGTRQARAATPLRQASRRSGGSGRARLGERRPALRVEPVRVAAQRLHRRRQRVRACHDCVAATVVRKPALPLQLHFSIDLGSFTSSSSQNISISQLATGQGRNTQRFTAKKILQSLVLYVAAAWGAPARLEHEREAKGGGGGVRVGRAGHAAEVRHRHARRRKVLLLQQLVLRARPGVG